MDFLGHFSEFGVLSNHSEKALRALKKGTT